MWQPVNMIYSRHFEMHYPHVICHGKVCLFGSVIQLFDTPALITVSHHCTIYIISISLSVTSINIKGISVTKAMYSCNKVRDPGDHYWDLSPHPMMTSSSENIFRVTGPLCGEITGHRWIPSQRPVTRNFAVFFICAWTNDTPVFWDAIAFSMMSLKSNYCDSFEDLKSLQISRRAPV